MEDDLFSSFFSRINKHKGPFPMSQSTQSMWGHTDYFRRDTRGNFRELLEVGGGLIYPSPSFPP